MRTMPFLLCLHVLEINAKYMVKPIPSQAFRIIEDNMWNNGEVPWDISTPDIEVIYEYMPQVDMNMNMNMNMDTSLLKNRNRNKPAKITEIENVWKNIYSNIDSNNLVFSAIIDFSDNYKLSNHLWFDLFMLAFSIAARERFKDKVTPKKNNYYFQRAILICCLWIITKNVEPVV